MSRFIGDKRKVVCLIIIVCIVFLSLLGILFVGRTTAGHTACIYSNGRLIKTVELDSESEQTFTVYSDDGGYKGQRRSYKCFGRRLPRQNMRKDSACIGRNPAYSMYASQAGYPC